MKGADIVGRDGSQLGLGELIDTLVERSGRKVTEIVKLAGISRAYFYVLRDGGQTPSLDTLVRVLGALGAEVKVGRPEEGEPDLVVIAPPDEWDLRLHLEGRNAARARGIREVSDAERVSEKPTGPTARTGSRYVVAAGAAPTSPRQSRLLSDLVEVASTLDEKRLTLLLSHARLLVEL